MSHDESLSPLFTTNKDTIPFQQTSLRHKLTSWVHIKHDESLIVMKNIRVVYEMLPLNFQRMIIGIVVLIIISPRLFYHLFFIGCAFFVGVMFRWIAIDDDDDTLRHQSLTRLRNLSFYHNTAQPPRTYPDITHYPIPAPLDKTIDKLTTLIIQDFILPWFSLINTTQSPHFPLLCKSSILFAFYKLGALAQDSEITSIIITISQTLILHLREFREIEKYGIGIQEYVKTHPESIFARLATRQQIQHHIQPVIKILLRRGMQKKEKSPLVDALLEEVLVGVFMGVIDYLSDPDVINLILLAYLKESQILQNDKNIEKDIQKQKERTTRRSRSSRIRDIKDTDKIFIKVVEGRHVRSSGLNDMYCIVMCGTESRKTKKVDAESNPIWLEEFTFFLGDDSFGIRKGVKGIVVDLYSMNILQDKLIGSVFIRLQDLQPNVFINKWFKLENSPTKRERENDAVELKLEIMYIKTDPASDTELDIDTDKFNGVLTDEIIDTLTIDSINNNDSLMDAFSEYLRRQSQQHIMHFFITLDSFRKFAKESSVAVQRQDARQIYDLYFQDQELFDTEFVEALGVNISEMGETFENNIEDDRDASGIFDGVLEVLSKLLDGFLRVFIETKEFQEIWAVDSKSIMFAIKKSKSIYQSTQSSSSPRISEAEDTKVESDRFYILGNALANLREQIMIIDTQLDEERDPKEELALFGERRRLHKQVDRILGMLDEDENEGDSVGLSLRGVKVCVFDLSGDGKIDANVLSGLGDRRRSSLESERESIDDEKDLEDGKKKLFGRRNWILRFAIHIERHIDGDETIQKHVLTKTFEEFDTIHGLLTHQFIKVGLVKFPKKPKNGYSGWEESARNTRLGCAQALEQWLVKLLGDEVICESKDFVKFLSDLDTGNCGSSEEIEVRRRTRSEAIGGKLFNVMKATTSVVKTVAKSAAINAPAKLVGFVDGIADTLMNDAPDSPDPRRRSKFSKDDQKDQISELDLEIILECVFSTVEEVFNLSHPDQWVRQKGLQLVKKLLRRAFGDTITTHLQHHLQNIKTATHASEILESLTALLWPSGEFFIKSPPPPRTDQQKLDTKLETKKLFVHAGLLPTEVLVHIVGRFNCVNGLTRVFNMWQDERGNRVFFGLVFDGVLRGVFDST